MSPETDRLDVTLLRRPNDAGAQNPGVAWPELYFTDFLVNGQSLHVLLGADKRDMAGCFMSLAVEGNWAELEGMLVGERQAELPNNRIGLFRCPLCGDLGCGAISFELTLRGDRVIWSRFALEVDWKVEGEPDESRLDFEPYADIGSFEFDLASYKAALRKAVALVSAPLGNPRRPER